MGQLLDFEVLYDKLGLIVQHKVLSDGWKETLIRGNRNGDFVGLSPAQARELAEVLIRSADETAYCQKAWNEMKDKAGHKNEQRFISTA